MVVSGRPQLQSADACDTVEILVGRQHCEIVPETNAGEQGVDRSNLNAATAAVVTQRCRVDVILPVGNQQRECGEPVQDRLAVFRTGKTLQQFLQHQSGCQNWLTVFEGMRERFDFGRLRRRVPSKRE